MITIDSRAGSGEGPGDLYPYINALRVPCKKEVLPAGDAYFEINGPEGPLPVGVERKTINDMLSCINDSRFSAGQKIKMQSYYAISFLCIEGMWEPGAYGVNLGWMFRAYRDPEKPGLHEKDRWGPARSFAGGQKVLYAKLFRYLLSLSMSPNLKIIFSYDIFHTAYNIVEIFNWGQKKRHTSLTEIQLVVVPELTGHPALVHRWAHDIDGIGNLRSQEAADLFKTPIRLANSEETDWMQVQGVGPETAKRIVRQIRGWKA